MQTDDERVGHLQMSNGTAARIRKHGEEGGRGGGGEGRRTASRTLRSFDSARSCVSSVKLALLRTFMA
jgi:hypothetical protein